MRESQRGGGGWAEAENPLPWPRILPTSKPAPFDALSPPIASPRPNESIPALPGPSASRHAAFYSYSSSSSLSLSPHSLQHRPAPSLRHPHNAEISSAVESDQRPGVDARSRPGNRRAVCRLEMKEMVCRKSTVYLFLVSCQTSPTQAGMQDAFAFAEKGHVAAGRQALFLESPPARCWHCTALRSVPFHPGSGSLLSQIAMIPSRRFSLSPAFAVR